MSYTAPNLTASGVTFAQLQAKGASGHLEALVAAQAATLDPTVAPTLAATADAGSTLTTGTYFVRVSETNGIGETLSIAAAASQAITSGTNHLTVTFQTLKAGNTARNVYASAVGASGPWTLAGSGITTSTFAISAPLPADSRAGVTVPATNTTGLTYVGASGQTMNRALSMIRAAEKGNVQDDWRILSTDVSNFTAGKPVDLVSLKRRINQLHTAFLAFSTVCSEIGVLIDANPGTVKPSATGIGTGTTVRVWP